MRNRSRSAFAAALAASAFLRLCAEKPAAFVTGAQMDVKVMSADVASKARIVHENYIRKWLPPSEYHRYSFIYFGDFLTRGLPPHSDWSKDSDYAAVLRYVDDGGVLVLSGSCARDLVATQPKAKGLIGFARSGDIARKDFGKGRVYLVGPLLGRLKLSFRGEPLGSPDEAGRFVLNDKGRKYEAVKRFYSDLFAELPGVAHDRGEIEWDDKPLGPKGDLSLPRTFRRQPAYRDAATPADGVVLYRPKDSRRAEVRANVVCADGDAETKALAEEVAWHLGKMSGTGWAVSDAKGAGPAIVLLHDDGERQSSRMRVDGDKVVLSGQGEGLSHAVTWFLESLGIRYLWPGELGKVIPKRDMIVFPKMSLDYVPELKLRELRGLQYDLGIDRPGNRSFRAWHGVNDMRENRMLGGHNFLDYWEKYGKRHPDWFAMQPDGTRNQDDNADRFASLCLSSEGFVAQAIADKLDQFAHRPDKDVLGIGLPDGGPTMQCLCRRCRRLDPVNAPPKDIGIPYVSLTDRVLSFDNRVAEAVTAKFPGKGLHMHAYAEYEDPPVRVRPHPAMVIACVVGDYSRPNGVGKARGDLASWLSFGNRVLWRPNLLMGFQTMAPQNYSRILFEDLEAMKANGLYGTDFDCFYELWSSLAITYYTLAKAHLNPFRMSYDALVDDYCETGFGKAAPFVRRYFAALEEMTDAARNGDPKVRNNLRMVAALDCDRLAAILADAERIADGDELRRVKFLGRGVEIGRWMKRLAKAYGEVGAEGYNAMVDETFRMLEGEDEVVVNPRRFAARRSNLFLLEPLLIRK